MMNKIKNALHKGNSDVDSAENTAHTGNTSARNTEQKAASHVPGHHAHSGTGAGTGATTGGTTGGSAVGRAEQTAASHMPGSGHRSGTTGTTGTGVGTGTGTGGQGAVGRAEQNVERHLPGHHSGSGSGTGTGVTSGTGMGSSGTRGTSGTGTGLGSGSGSGTHSYQVGNQADVDARRGDMSNIVSSTGNVPMGGHGQSVRETLTASYDKQHWKEAEEKTELAEREVATAAMEADRADKALAAAQNAQGVVNREANEHDRLLTEAERQRGLVNDPSSIRGDLDAANNDLRLRQQEAERHNRALREAEQAARAKQGEFDSLTPNLRKNEQALQGLASEYDTAMSKRDAVYGDAERLRGIAAEKERTRDGLGATIEELMERLRLAEQEMVERERAFLAARDNHCNLHNKLRGLRGELDTTNTEYQRNASAANAAVESAHGWDDKTNALRARLSEYENEHKRLLGLIESLKAELERLIAQLEGLRRQGQPNHQAIVEAEGFVNNKRDALRQAEIQSKEAEARYRQLISEADRHKASGTQAAGVAKEAGQEYQRHLKEAEIHGDRHAQLWQEAQSAGNMGSSDATSTFQKLQAKVNEFAHREA